MKRGLEAAGLLVALGVLLVSGPWVAAPIEDAGCPGVVRFELATPSTFDDLVADCREPAALGDGLRDSTWRDFAFIAIYGAQLGWCAWRAKRSRWSRAARWLVPLAAGADVVENAGLLRTASHVADPRAAEIWLTAGASSVKWLALLVPIAVALRHLFRLVVNR